MMPGTNTPEAQDGYGMDMQFAEQTSRWFESGFSTIRNALGPTNSLVVGLVGVMASGWLMYLLVIQATPLISFNTKFTQTLLKPTYMSYHLKQSYWALHGLPIQKRLRTTRKNPPPRARKALAGLQKALDRYPDYAITKKVVAARNLQQLHTVLYKHLENAPARANSYASYFARNVLRPGAFTMDLAIFFFRLVLVALLLIFSIRLFFDEDSQTSEG
ncbi:MAG: hypothetical protein EP343_13590 [Deltaproteobacteria bacterium]|nr:MAG: hypothetical protein EP343_13590 [Deltaproteobacteria bacterium]